MVPCCRVWKYEASMHFLVRIETDNSKKQKDYAMFVLSLFFISHNSSDTLSVHLLLPGTPPASLPQNSGVTSNNMVSSNTFLSPQSNQYVDFFFFFSYRLHIVRLLRRAYYHRGTGVFVFAVPLISVFLLRGRANESSKPSERYRVPGMFFLLVFPRRHPQSARWDSTRAYTPDVAGN